MKRFNGRCTRYEVTDGSNSYSFFTEAQTIKTKRNETMIMMSKVNAYAINHYTKICKNASMWSPTKSE